MKTHVYIIAADPFDPRFLFAATSVGLLATSDAGRSWRIADRGLCGDHVHSIVMEAGPTLTVFACTDGGVYKSDDRGGNWERVTAQGS